MIWFSRRTSRGRGSGQREKLVAISRRNLTKSFLNTIPQSVRGAASLGSRAVLSACPRRGARRSEKRRPRKPARGENLWGTKKRAGSAHLPDHLIGLHGGLSPGPLAEERSGPTRSRARAWECPRGRALAGSSSSRKSTRRPWQPPTKLDPAIFRRPACELSFASHFKRERAPRVGYYRSFARARGVLQLGHVIATARITGVRSRRVSHRPRLKRSRAIARAKDGASRAFDALNAPSSRSRDASLHLTRALSLQSLPSSGTRRANVNPANRLPRRWRPRLTPCSRARSATTTRR